MRVNVLRDPRGADSARRVAALIDPSIQTVSNKKGYTKRALEPTLAVKWGGLRSRCF